MERDDIIEYSLDNHHSEEEGKLVRKKIYKVTLILSLITAVEVAAGIIWPKSEHDGSTLWATIKWSYILLTLFKAGYIVAIFMHLGDERKALKMFILVPYILFVVYLIWLVLTEATAIQNVWMRLFS
jgi:cytochrome c oxidase subunit IV